MGPVGFPLSLVLGVSSAAEAQVCVRTWVPPRTIAMIRGMSCVSRLRVPLGIRWGHPSPRNMYDSKRLEV